jgi:hypothetical protein
VALGEQLLLERAQLLGHIVERAVAERQIAGQGQPAASRVEGHQVGHLLEEALVILMAAIDKKTGSS